VRPAAEGLVFLLQLVLVPVIEAIEAVEEARFGIGVRIEVGIEVVTAVASIVGIVVGC
jgi:hypothetical protein